MYIDVRVYKKRKSMKKALGLLVFFALIFGFKTAFGLHRTRMNIRFEAYSPFRFSRSYRTKLYTDFMMYKNKRIQNFDVRLLITLGFAGYGMYRLRLMENRVETLEMELRNSRQEIITFDSQADLI